MTDERERGVCGACVKRSRHSLIHPRSHAMDGSLPPTVAGFVKNKMDLFDNERRELPAPTKDWELGYSTFVKDIPGTSFLTVLQFHVNGGKAVVVWRQHDEVSLLRFKEEVTRGFHPLSSAEMDSFRLLPNGLAVNGAVARMHDVMTGKEVDRLVQGGRERILDPGGWDMGKFRNRTPMLVLSLSRSKRVEASTPRPQLSGPVDEDDRDQESRRKIW
jgi:hypothetical protein